MEQDAHASALREGNEEEDFPSGEDVSYDGEIGSGNPNKVLDGIPEFTVSGGGDDVKTRIEDSSVVAVTASYVPLSSLEAATTLCRFDEKAYRDACGRPHLLRMGGHGRAKKEHLRSEFVAIYRHGRAMKAQRRRLYAQLREAEEHRAHIILELDAVKVKLAARAKRVEAAKGVWREWCEVRGYDPEESPLKAVCSTSRGRELFHKFLEEQQTLNPSAAASLWLALEALVHGRDTTEAGSVTYEECAIIRKKWLEVGGGAAGVVGTSLFILGPLVDELASANERVARTPEHSGPLTGALTKLRDATNLEVQRLYWDSFFEGPFGSALMRKILSEETTGEGETMRQSRVSGKDWERNDTESGGSGPILGAFFSDGDEGNWVDTNLLHAGIQQRVRVKVIEPQLKELLADVNDSIHKCRGEMAVIVQHTYSLAASHIQRVIRSSLERMRLDQRRRDLLAQAFFCAAVELQCMFRQNMARVLVHGILMERTAASFVTLQALARGFLVRRRIARRWRQLHWAQATEIQRVFRGYRGRLESGKAAVEAQWARNTGLHGWAVLIMQRYVRGWLARKVVVAKKLELGLTERVSKLADKFMSSGDMWAFLDQVDKDYRRYEQVIDDMQRREEKMAATFVQKVLEKRDTDIARAWRDFTDSAIGHSQKLRQRSCNRRPHPQSPHRDGAAGRGAKEGEHLVRVVERYLDPSTAQALPGAYLRGAMPAQAKLAKAISTDTKEENARAPAPKKRWSNPLKSERRVGMDGATRVFRATAGGLGPEIAESQGIDVAVKSDCAGPLRKTKGCESGAKRDCRVLFPAPDPGPAPDLGPAPAPNKTNCLRKGRKRARPTDNTYFTANNRDTSATESPNIIGMIETEQTESWSRSSVHGSNGDGCSPQDTEIHGTAGQRQPTSCSNARLISAPSNGNRQWSVYSFGTTRGKEGGAGLNWETAWDQEREHRGLRMSSSSRFPGSSALRDVPLGMEDNVDRFCAAAFLRGYVPSIMLAGTTPQEAFRRYTELPPSLVKIRHEEECSRASNPVAASLRASGFSVVRHLMPPSKLKHLLHSAGAPPHVTATAASLACELRLISTPAGRLSSRSSEKMRELTGGAHTLAEVLRVTRASSSRQGGRVGNPGEMTEERGVRVGGGVERGGMTGAGSAENEDTGGKDSHKLGKRGKGTGLNISVGDVRLVVEGEETKGKDYDPRKYVAHPEQWFKPLGSVVKRRWEDKSKTFVNMNNYNFDDLYRRHRPRPARTETNSEDIYLETDSSPTGGQNGDAKIEIPGVTPQGFSNRRKDDIMRDEHGTFFEGMTPTARELFEVTMNDTRAWGSPDETIQRFLCHATFYVVEHPSPPTKAEFEVAAEEDRFLQGFGKKANRLSRPLTLAGKFSLGKAEQALMDAAMTREKVSPGLEAFRAFIVDLDAAGLACPCTPSTPQPLPGQRRRGKAPPDRRRTLLARRLEATENLILPYIVRLEADGVSSLRVLAQIPARKWGIPDKIVEQAERMLGLLIASTCATECGMDSFAIDSEDNKRRRKAGQAVVIPFDPRFQRSAIDPYGRPPRLDPLRPSPKRRVNHDARGEEEETVQLPHGVWEVPDRSTPTVKEDANVKWCGKRPSLCGGSGGRGEVYPGDKKANSSCKSEMGMHPPLRVQENGAVGKGRAPRRASKATSRSKLGSTNRRLPWKDPASGRYKCRKPGCRAEFGRMCNLRSHERAHGYFPAYQRLKVVPQLFRDPSPQPSEIAGGKAVGFRLRTELPASVQDELLQLQAAGLRRRRNSLLALPGLPGAMATWAGVATPVKSTTAKYAGSTTLTSEKILPVFETSSSRGSDPTALEVTDSVVDVDVVEKDGELPTKIHDVLDPPSSKPRPLATDTLTSVGETASCPGHAETVRLRRCVSWPGTQGRGMLPTGQFTGECEAEPLSVATGLKSDNTVPKPWGTINRRSSSLIRRASRTTKPKQVRLVAEPDGQGLEWRLVQDSGNNEIDPAEKIEIRRSSEAMVGIDGEEPLVVQLNFPQAYQRRLVEALAEASLDSPANIPSSTTNEVSGSRSFHLADLLGIPPDGTEENMKATADMPRRTSAILRLENVPVGDGDNICGDSAGLHRASLVLKIDRSPSEQSPRSGGSKDDISDTTSSSVPNTERSVDWEGEVAQARSRYRSYEVELSLPASFVEQLWGTKVEGKNCDGWSSLVDFMPPWLVGHETDPVESPRKTAGFTELSGIDRAATAAAATRVKKGKRRSYVVELALPDDFTQHLHKNEAVKKDAKGGNGGKMSRVESFMSPWLLVNNGTAQSDGLGSSSGDSKGWGSESSSTGTSERRTSFSEVEQDTSLLVKPRELGGRTSTTNSPSSSASLTNSSRTITANGPSSETSLTSDSSGSSTSSVGSSSDLGIISVDRSTEDRQGGPPPDREAPEANSARSLASSFMPPWLNAVKTREHESRTSTANSHSSSTSITSNSSGSNTSLVGSSSDPGIIISIDRLKEDRQEGLPADREPPQANSARSPASSFMPPWLNSDPSTYTDHNSDQSDTTSGVDSTASRSDKRSVVKSKRDGSRTSNASRIRSRGFGTDSTESSDSTDTGSFGSHDTSSCSGSTLGTNNSESTSSSGSCRSNSSSPSSSI